MSPTARKKQTEPTIGKTILVISGDLPSLAVDLVQVKVPYTLTLEGMLSVGFQRALCNSASTFKKILFQEIKYSNNDIWIYG